MGKRKRTKEKTKKLRKQFTASLESKLKSDLEKLGKDWQDLISKKADPSNNDFLKEMAQDIKQLNDDAMLAESDEELGPTSHMIHDLLTIPWAPPAISTKNFLEASISFEFQKPEESDLSNLLSNCNIYSTVLNNQFITILESLEERH
ncbi:MAG TPA: hypothetical protein VLG44_02020 [Chlamydiales bacterium]|nr:hypothetical protein [Chlamydiales bacterium]